jgi:hypothetical protein
VTSPKYGDEKAVRERGRALVIPTKGTEVEAISNSRGSIGTLKPKGKGKREGYLQRKDEHGAGSSNQMSRKTGRDFQTYLKRGRFSTRNREKLHV